MTDRERESDQLSVISEREKHCCKNKISADVAVAVIMSVDAKSK